jgi:membrane-associated phospholipid phosphatase
MLASLHWPAVGLRAAIVAGALVVWFWTQSLIGRKSVSKGGIGDVVHDLTARWHAHLRANPGAANATLIASSFFIDLFGLSLIAAAIFGRTFAPFLGVLILFALRQVCQSLCTLPPPPGIIWRNPGFPTLLVTYDVGNDFFFSGHTALAVLGAIEAAHLAPPWVALIAACIAVGEMCVVLVLRAHYTLDVIAGVLAAFLAADVAQRLSPSLDVWLR